MPNLHYELLPEALILSKYVPGFEKYPYEDYLIELLNASEWAKEKFGDSFTHAESESRGECDAYADGYGLDFKLLISTSKCRSLRELSSKIEEQPDGMVTFSVPKSKDEELAKRVRADGTLDSTRVHVLLRFWSLEGLRSIPEYSENRKCINTDIKNALGVLETEKNIFIFFPYEFFYKEPIEEGAAIENIMKAVFADLKAAFEYRREKTDGLDTYFSFIYQDQLVICEPETDAFRQLDVVDVYKSQIYSELSRFTY